MSVPPGQERIIRGIFHTLVENPTGAVGDT